MRKNIILIIITTLFLVFPHLVSSQDKPLNLYFFYGETCPHCQKAEAFLDKLPAKYPSLTIKSYEVFSNKDNAKLFQQLLEACGKDKTIRVPAIFIGDDVLIGYLDDQTTGKTIEETIKKNLSGNYPDPMEKLGQCQTCNCSKGEPCQCQVCTCPQEQQKINISAISLPLIGKVDLSKLSLPVITVILGALDGFNPCAMWILLFLIALLINLRSKRKMWLIGGVFILSSAIFYFLLLTAWLNLFLAISYIHLTRLIIGLVAIILGVWQLKKFFEYKPAVCPTTDGTSMEGRLKNKAQKIVESPISWLSIIGVIALAVSINLVEFFCSAGLPAIYTQILALNHLSAVSYYLYLLLYTLVFVLDDIIVFCVAVFTLGLFSLNEKYNRWSGLIGAIVILLVGLLFIFKPDLLVF